MTTSMGGGGGGGGGGRGNTMTNLGLWISSWNYVCIKISSPLVKIS